MMEFLRKLAISLACFVLFTSLTLFGAAFATLHVLGEPAPIESALQKANVYHAIVTNFVQSNLGNSTVGLSLNIPAVQSALQKAFPDSVVESAVNQVINGTYAWMQGKTKTIEFQINLTNERANLATYVQQAAQQQAAQMPVCSYDQILNDPGIATQNPLSVTCVPPGVSAAAIGNMAKQAVLNSSFLKNPVLTPSNFAISSDSSFRLPDESSTPHTISLRQAYHHLRQTFYLSIWASIVCILAIALLHRNRLKGLGRAGAVISWAGFTCIIEALIIGKVPQLLDTTKLTQSLQAAGSLQQSVIKLITVLANDFYRWLLGYGATLLVVGLGCWVIIRIWQRREGSKKSEDTSDLVAKDNPKQLDDVKS